jgi:hypothetical protein
MIRLWGCAVALCLAASAACQAWTPGGFISKDRVIYTDRDASVLRPTELVTPPHVTRADWSPSGANLLAWRRNAPRAKDIWGTMVMDPDPKLPEPIPPRALVVRNRTTGRSHDAWSSPVGPDPPEVHWIGTSDVALVAIIERQPAAAVTCECSRIRRGRAPS